jgi:hypothetical protein
MIPAFEAFSQLLHWSAFVKADILQTCAFGLYSSNLDHYEVYHDKFQAV